MTATLQEIDLTELKQVFYGRSSAESIELAAKEGLLVDVAQEDELQVDLDSLEAEAQAAKMLPFVATLYGCTHAVKSTSRSGKKHLRVFLLNPLPVVTRIALQSILGSDPMKEIHSLKKVKEGDPKPILFFEPAPVNKAKPVRRIEFEEEYV